MSLLLSTLYLCIVACESKSISPNYVTDCLKMLDRGGIKLFTCQSYTSNQEFVGMLDEQDYLNNRTQQLNDQDLL
jgi:hypothetical protein